MTKPSEYYKTRADRWRDVQESFASKAAKLIARDIDERILVELLNEAWGYNLTEGDRNEIK